MLDKLSASGVWCWTSFQLPVFEVGTGSHVCVYWQNTWQLLACPLKFYCAKQVGCWLWIVTVSDCRSIVDDCYHWLKQGSVIGCPLLHVAERLALPTSDNGVAGGEILPEPKRRFIAQSLSYSPFHCLEVTEILLKGRKTLTHPSILLLFVCFEEFAWSKMSLHLA